MNTDFTPLSEISRKKIKDAILSHYRVIEKTQDSDLLRTAFSRLVNDMAQAIKPLDGEQSAAIGKAMESSAFMISQGVTLPMAREWIINQLEDRVFEGFHAEFVD